MEARIRRGDGGGDVGGGGVVKVHSTKPLKRGLEYSEAPAMSMQDQLSPEEWVRQFHAWAEGHDRTTPLLSDEAISRENIYPDRI